LEDSSKRLPVAWRKRIGCPEKQEQEDELQLLKLGSDTDPITSM
jgi:hypothetical protein